MARTRMTESLFPDMMAKPEEGFDKMAAENVAPLVTWLGSAESKDVTGRVFEVGGGLIVAAEGWRRGPTIEQEDRWDPAKLGPVVRDLLEGAQRPAVIGAS
jgi:hypothetical protein